MLPLVPVPQEPPAWSLEAAWIGEATHVVGGGLNRGGSERSLLTLSGEADLGALSGIDGAGTLFAQWLSINPERGGTLDAGDVQVTSNIESDESRDGVYELWYEHELESLGQRWKVGKVDANGEFALVESGVEFAHSSAGFGPTIVGFPTYPDSAYSINGFQRIDDRWTMGYGFYDGSFGALGVRTGRRGPETFVGGHATGDHFHVAEARYFDDDEEADRRFSVGGWWHTGRFERLDGGSETGVGGVFATWEEQLPSTTFERVDVFGQFSFTDGAISEIERHAGVGLRVGGLLPGRDEDSAGLYVSLVDLSDGDAPGPAGQETAVDVYYRFVASGHLALQPEVHFVDDPGGGAGPGDAWIVSLRVEVTL